MQQAIDLAIEERGGRAGHWRVEHVRLDGGSTDDGSWSARQERANATAAVNDPAVIAYIGPYNSGAARFSLPITNRAHLLQLSPTMTWPGLTEQGWEAGEPDAYYPTGRRTFARLMPSDAWQAEVAARRAGELGARKAFVLRDGSTYSDGLARRFALAARSHGLEVVGEADITHTRGTELAGQVRQSRADVVFYAPSTTGNAVMAARALADVPLSTGVFASDTALSDQFMEAAGDSAPRWWVVYNGFVPPLATDEWRQFEQAFMRRYAVTPSQFAANAYDLTNLVLDALERIDVPDRRQVSELVLGTRGYAGVTGIITFTPEGDVHNWRMSVYRLAADRAVFDRLLEGGATTP